MTQQKKHKEDAFNLFPHNKNAVIIYNHYNNVVSNKIINILSEFNITVHKTRLDQDEYFILIYEDEETREVFFKHLKKVINHILDKLKIHLITAEFPDVVGIITHIDKSRIIPLGLQIKNTPFLNTNIKGDFTAYPKTVNEAYEVLTICHDNKNYDLVSAEFGYKGDKSSLIYSITKIERMSIINTRITTQVLL